MAAAVLDMSMSLDGFVAGPNETPDNGLGDGGDRLHEWFFAGEATEHAGVPGRPSGVDGEMMDEAMATGAVVAGRGTTEPAGFWGGDHHDGVPIFILSRRPEAEVAQWPLVTYVSEVEVAMARAKEAAGEKDVLVHGAGVARLFEHLGADGIELEQTRVREGAGVTHLRYRVLS